MNPKKSIVALSVVTLMALLFVLSLSRMRSASTDVPKKLRAEAPRPHLALPESSKEANGEAIVTERGIVGTQKMFNAPISFYGKVVDQFKNSVPDADVRFRANDKPNGEPSTFFSKSDSNGLFSIQNIHGLTLGVRVSKQGFRTVDDHQDGKPASSKLFDFAMDTGVGIHRADPARPVEFILQKAGTPAKLTYSHEKHFRLARDGTPVNISFDGGGPAQHQVEVRCWNEELNRPPGQRKYDWRLEISILRGGLTTRSQPLDFQAPEAGYQPSDTVSMVANAPNWSNFWKRSYFVKFNDGIFARVDVNFGASGDHYLIWKSYLNPKPGDRNLETSVK